MLYEGDATSCGRGWLSAGLKSVLRSADSTIDKALRVVVPCGNVVSLSYSQRRNKLLKGYCQFVSRRLLVFARTSVFVTRCQPTLHPPSLVTLYHSPASLGPIVFGSFLSDHKSNRFVTIHEADLAYSLHTFTLSEGGERQSVREGHDKTWEREHCRGWHKSSSANSMDQSPLDNEAIYVVQQQEELLLPQLKGLNVTCIRLFKNVNYGEAELIMTTSTILFTITILPRPTSIVRMQDMGMPINSVEYWNGYYFILYANNLVTIYKRNMRGVLEQVKTIHIVVPPLGVDLYISQIKVPVLEWSDRLADILHKQLPRHLLLIGQVKEGGKTRCCLIKYDIHRGAYSTSASIDTTSIITCINYGPYDNGPIMLGFNDGRVMIFDYYTLDVLLHLNVETSQNVKWITYEPGCTLIVGTEDSIHTCDIAGNKRTPSQSIAAPPQVLITHANS